MATTFYDATVPKMDACMQALSSILEKASTTKEESLSSLLEARLVPDMLPLAFQVHSATDGAAKLAARVSGNEAADLGAYTDCKTYDDCKKRIEKARELLKAVDKESYNARADTVIEFAAGPGKTGKLPAKDYADSFTFPNVYFHVVMAYSILRKEGVELGKRDYLMSFGISKAEITTN